MGVSVNGGYPQNTPKSSFLVGKPMVVGYHHFRKPPYGHSTCHWTLGGTCSLDVQSWMTCYAANVTDCGGRSNIITVSILHTKRLSIPIQFSSAYVSSFTANKIWGKQKIKGSASPNTTYPTKSRNLATGILVAKLPTILVLKKKTRLWSPPLSTKAGSFLVGLLDLPGIKSWWLVVPRSEKYDGQNGSFRIKGENNKYA